MQKKMSIYQRKCKREGHNYLVVDIIKRNEINSAINLMETNF